MSPATLAHLLKYDSTRGPLKASVGHTVDTITVDGLMLQATAERYPPPPAGGSIGVELAIESTGRFRTRDSAGAHAEARKVLLSVPCKDVDATIVLSVDDSDPAQHYVVSNASCTTNCAAPVVSVLHRPSALSAA